MTTISWCRSITSTSKRSTIWPESSRSPRYQSAWRAHQTASFLISPDPQLTGELAMLNTGSEQLGIPYRIGECNSFYNGGAPGVSNSCASSL
jgi:hypothetical protein